MKSSVLLRSMWQETQAEPFAFVRTFDDPGNVRHHEALAIVIRDDPQIGNEGGERVVSDLRFGGGDHAEQRALARIRKAN